SSTPSRAPRSTSAATTSPTSNGPRRPCGRAPPSTPPWSCSARAVRRYWVPLGGIDPLPSNPLAGAMASEFSVVGVRAPGRAPAWWPVDEKGRTLSKTTQRRAAVAALSFALGAAGTLPAFAAHSGSSDTQSAPDAISSLGDTLYNLPYVSFMPGQDNTSADNSTDTSGDFADTPADSAPAGGGGIVGGLGGIVGGLPLVGGLVQNLPIVGSGGGAGLAGGLPLVGPVVGTVGGLAANLPVVGPLASSLPVVGPMIGGASTSGAGLGSVVGGLPLVGGIVSSLPIVGSGGALAGGGLPVVGPVLGALPVGGVLSGLLGGLPLVGGIL